MKPLNGLKVIDFSTLLPGPMASLILAEAGASVTKIERPGTGDEMRTYQPRWGEQSVNFAMLNRGKTTQAIDLKSEEGRARAIELVRDCDVVIEQFRPGVMERLGLGYTALSEINPNMIYCSISGYGQNGPMRDVAGHDLNYLATSGLLSLSMGTSEQPVIPPALIADIAGGAYPAVMNILMALRERDLVGHGRYLDIAMTDNLFPFAYWAIGEGFATGRWPGNGSDLVTGGTPRYRLYAASDGRMIAAAPIEQKFWSTFCEIVGLAQELRDDSRDPRATAAEVERLIAERSGEEWEELFRGRDCCCCLVRNMDEAVIEPHFAARGIFDDEIEQGANLIPALPVPLDRGLRGNATRKGVPQL
jgi:crotonobetainyl-CoA:carnitine CoA-transferase CaiB-like acyl-CoA transferase